MQGYPPNPPPPPGGGYPPSPPGGGGGGYGPPPGGAGGSPYGYGPPPGQPGAFGPPPGMPGMPGMAMASPNAPYGIEPMTGLPFSDKQKMVAGLLQIFLPFGVGRFYTGHIGIGFAQLAVSLFTCGGGGLWSLIDGIMMLTGKVTDVNGRPLREG